MKNVIIQLDQYIASDALLTYVLEVLCDASSLQQLQYLCTQMYMYIVNVESLLAVLTIVIMWHQVWTQFSNLRP